MARAEQGPRRVVVVKVGTSTLTRGGGALCREAMLELARALVMLRRAGDEVVLVSSGAMAAGREALGHPRLPPLMSAKQMLASVGQGHLMRLWSELFGIFGVQVGQLLLTRADLEDRERYLNAHDTLFALLGHGILPIINENDAVSTREIKIGDNDNLAALTAVMCSARLVILLTDQKGLYTQDPRTCPDATLIGRVELLDAAVLALGGGAGSAQGTGGMATKLTAARTATEAGVELVIAAGANPAQIPALARGEGEGTFFTPQPRHLQRRKSWLATAVRPQGVLVVDQGAARALLGGSSLLPSGIVAVHGEFLPGALVEVSDLEGGEVARGIARYAAHELRQIQGRKSTEIGQVLGMTRGDVAIHRDDLVLRGEEGNA